MKKMLAVLLALTMIFTLCIPVFATNVPETTKINQDTAQDPADSGIHKGTGVVAVNGNDKKNENFSVTFPAEVSLTWGKVEEQTLTYDLVCQLQATHRLQVTATVNPAKKLVATDGSGDEIAYTFDSPVVTSTSYNVTAPESYNIGFTIADWSKAPLKEYKDTVTFSVQVVTPGP